MVVYGLTLYVRTLELPTLTFSSLVEQHQQQHPNKPLTLLVDGDALLNYLFEAKDADEQPRFPLCWLNGGHYTTIGRTIVKYLDLWLRHACVEMVIVFEGCVLRQQEPTRQMANTAATLSDACLNFNKFFFANRRKPAQDERPEVKSVLMPTFTRDVLLYVAALYPDQLKVVQAPYESSYLMASYAFEKQKEGTCYVLTDNSDFYIYPSAGCFIFSLLFYADDGDIEFGLMNHRELAKCLKMDTTQLIALACLAKNQYNVNKRIEEFHTFVLSKKSNQHFVSGNPYYSIILLNGLVSYLKKLYSSCDDLDRRSTIFELFRKALPEDKFGSELLQIAKDTYDTYSGATLSDKIDYSSIIPLEGANRIREFKNLMISSDLINIVSKRHIEFSVLIENPKWKGSHHSWTQYKERLYHYLFFHEKSLWRVAENIVTVKEGTIIEGKYKRLTYNCRAKQANEMFPTKSDAPMQIFSRIWLLQTVSPEELVLLLENGIERYDWPIVCVYLALKYDVIPSNPQYQFKEWELDTIFSSFFWFKPDTDPKILQIEGSCDETKSTARKADLFMSPSFYHLVALFNAGLQIFELCIMALQIMPIQEFRGSTLRYNGSLVVTAYEKKLFRKVDWFVDNDHEKRYRAVMKALHKDQTTPKSKYLAQRSDRVRDDTSEKRPKRTRTK